MAGSGAEGSNSGFVEEGGSVGATTGATGNMGPLLAPGATV